MQTLRHKRLAQQLNQTAMALISEAHMLAPQDARELRELATEIDRVRVAYFTGHAGHGAHLALPPKEAA